MKERATFTGAIMKLWQHRYPGAELSEQNAKEISIKAMDVITVMLEWKFRENPKNEDQGTPAKEPIEIKALVSGKNQ